jgi:hypothetical protein
MKQRPEVRGGVPHDLTASTQAQAESIPAGAVEPHRSVARPQAFSLRRVPPTTTPLLAFRLAAAEIG